MGHRWSRLYPRVHTAPPETAFRDVFGIREGKAIRVNRESSFVSLVPRFRLIPWWWLVVVIVIMVVMRMVMVEMVMLTVRWWLWWWWWWWSWWWVDDDGHGGDDDNDDDDDYDDDNDDDGDGDDDNDYDDGDDVLFVLFVPYDEEGNGLVFASPGSSVSETWPPPSTAKWVEIYRRLSWCLVNLTLV